MSICMDCISLFFLSCYAGKKVFQCRHPGTIQRRCKNLHLSAHQLSSSSPSVSYIVVYRSGTRCQAWTILIQWLLPMIKRHCLALQCISALPSGRCTRALLIRQTWPSNTLKIEYPQFWTCALKDFGAYYQGAVPIKRHQNKYILPSLERLCGDAVWHACHMWDGDEGWEEWASEELAASQMTSSGHLRRCSEVDTDNKYLSRVKDASILSWPTIRGH
jgi:hypothetical protein